MSTTEPTAEFPFDKQDQVDKIRTGLLPGESIIAVYDGKGGMLGKLASSSSVAVTVGSATYEIEFRGEDKAKHAHDVMLGFMS